MVGNMGYRVSGILKLPDGTPANNAEIEFISRKNFSPLVQELKSNIRCSETGAYDVTLEYGEYAVIVYPGGAYPAAIGTIILAADTVAGKDLPTLLQQAGWQPATPEHIQQIKLWLAEASASATKSTASASAAKVSETNSKASEIAAEADRSEVAANTADVRVKHSDVVAKSAQVSIDSSATQAAKSTAVSAADTATQKALDAAESEASAFSSATRAEASAVKSAADGAAQAALAKSQADRAKAEADRASQISGLGTVSDAIGLAALPLPDVWAPLSDSLRLITGYGRDVLVGSDVVARTVNFSRSSTATYIGKDGLLKTAAVNEPRFEKEGLLLEGQSTNLITGSSGPSFLNGYTLSGTTKSPMSGQDAKVLEYTGVNPANSYIRFNTPAASVATDTKTASCYVMAIGQALSIAIECDDYATKTIACPADTWVRISTTRTTPSGAFSNFIDIMVPAAASGQRLAVWGGQLEALPFASSYIPTNGAAVTRAADQAWLPAAGNRFIGGLYAMAFEFDLLGRVPSVGFTRLVDFDNSGGADRQHFSLNDGGQLQCMMGTGAVAGVAGKLSGRAAMRMGNFTMNVMMDGVAGSSVTASGVSSSLNNRIVLMNSNLFNLPSYGHIRNIRMWIKHPISNDQLRTAA